MKYIFSQELKNGIVRSRPNRFIMNVEIGDDFAKCHCPTTGRIGNLAYDNLSCLLSESTSKNRSTKYTVEAVSADDGESWIGINQTLINKYVDFFINNGSFDRMLNTRSFVKREVNIAGSRIDFSIDNVLLEVKMPLMLFQQKKITNNKQNKKFNSFERLIRHMEELIDSMDSNGKALMLICFVYDAPTFAPKASTEDKLEIRDVVDRAQQKGVEFWQANFSINNESIDLIKYFKLTL